MKAAILVLVMLLGWGIMLGAAWSLPIGKFTLVLTGAAIAIIAAALAVATKD